MNNKILLIIASKHEKPSFSLPDIFDLIITGQGKINAYEKTICHSMSRSYNFFVNLGISGSLNDTYNLKSIYSINKVIQTDMFFLKNKSIDILPLYKSKDKNLILASQDSPVLNKKEKKRLANMGADLVDMELYGIARAASKLNKKLYSLKIISDNSNENSVKQIKKNIIEYKDYLWDEFIKIFESGDYFND